MGIELLAMALLIPYLLPSKENGGQHNNQGISYFKEDKIFEAVEEFKSAIKINPNNAPAPILSRSIGKLRKQQRFDYADNQLNKRLDTFLRSYLALKHIKM